MTDAKAKLNDVIQLDPEHCDHEQDLLVRLEIQADSEKNYSLARLAYLDGEFVAAAVLQEISRECWEPFDQLEAEERVSLWTRKFREMQRFIERHFGEESGVDPSKVCPCFRKDGHEVHLFSCRNGLLPCRLLRQS
jgi:hypothetical protein